MSLGSNLSIKDDDNCSGISYGSSYESEDGNSSAYTTKNMKRLPSYQGKKEVKKIERKPTRVPNLKIQNRNALLARENRRKKKEMLENLDKEVSRLQAENKNLHKMLKFKNSKIDRLSREVKYLKSVISNRTEIVCILKSLSKFPMNTCDENQNEEQWKKNINQEENKFTYSNTSSSDTLSCNTSSISDENGSKIMNDKFLSSQSSFDEFFLDEIETVAADWDEILKDPFCSDGTYSNIPMLDKDVMSPILSDISTDHNYSHLGQCFGSKEMNESLPGICLHINSGNTKKVSLEFCSVCHHNATKSSTWMELND